MSTPNMENDDIEQTPHSIDHEKELRRLKKTEKCKLSMQRNALFVLVNDENVITDEILQHIALVEQSYMNVSSIIDSLENLYLENNRQKEADKTLLEGETMTDEFETEMATIRGRLSTRGHNGEANRPTRPPPDSTARGTRQVTTGRLESIRVPEFSGDKTEFDTYWMAFIEVVDKSDESPAGKMIRLINSPRGKAKDSIKGLGYTETEYEAAKNILSNKYGGKCRQLQNYLDEVERLEPVKGGNIDGLSKLSEALNIAVAKLRASNRIEDLQNGAWYRLVCKKVPESLLIKYYEHLENELETEGLEGLSIWLTHVVKRQARARETVRGLKENSYDRQTVTTGGRRTFVTHRDPGVQTCRICKSTNKHDIENCRDWKKMNIDDRWTAAKRNGLCFRCLKSNHRGIDCKTHRRCGINDCPRSHHKSLHKDIIQKSEPELPTETFQNSPNSYCSVRNKDTVLIGMRAVPVLIKNNGNSRKVIMLIDECSDVSYINITVAQELRLKGKNEKINVKVMDGTEIRSTVMKTHAEIFHVNGNQLTAGTFFVIDQVCGEMPVINWKSLQKIGLI
ncbi:uncharacterized protein LOC141898992 [Tubulanus polymorphus]|uniref:uncharacterized protein LOC141898992 n=1 Tax=Tubulanus polymorphus TaxID=672921 RepID=UPI003DA3A5FA